MYEYFLPLFYILFSGSSVHPLDLFVCVSGCCFCLVVFHNFFLFLKKITCLSFGVFCVWLPLSLCKNFALHTVVFRLSASDLHLPLPFQTFAPSPFMFSSSHFSCSCCFFGDLICSVVTFFCSLFQVE